MNDCMLSPHITRLHISLADDREAVVDIHVTENGIGGIDQPWDREATVREMDLIGRMIADRKYNFNSTLV